MPQIHDQAPHLPPTHLHHYGILLMSCRTHSQWYPILRPSSSPVRCAFLHVVTALVHIRDILAQEFCQWLRDVLFPLIDSLGQESIKNVRLFWSQTKLSLPAPYTFAETACTKDFLSNNYHVVYQGHHVGITAVQCATHHTCLA